MIKMLCARVVRKLLAQDTVFRCVSGFFRSVLPYNPQVVAQAYRDLSACSPDPGYSALRQNQVETAPPYDVQIIIPAYNAEAFIAGCLDSVLRLDTAFRIWIVVVNDGSTDRTGEILQQYAGDSRVQIMNQENRGFSGARNRGLQSIRARYVLFLDADDELLDLQFKDWGGTEGGMQILQKEDMLLSAHRQINRLSGMRSVSERMLYASSMVIPGVSFSGQNFLSGSAFRKAIGLKTALCRCCSFRCVKSGQQPILWFIATG